MAKYIIVGQGLAGSILALNLLEANQNVILFDQPERNISSRIAAGLFNPVTGRRFVKTWKADRLFPALLTFYPYLEKKLNTRFFYEKPIVRPFFNVKEQNEINSRNNQMELGHYIDRIEPDTIQGPFKNIFSGGVFLKKCGYLDIHRFLNASRKFFLAEGILKNAFLNEKELVFQSNKICYGSNVADKILFCNGISAITGDLFSWLPFRPVKGEIIHIEMEGFLDSIFNRKIFILPFSSNKYKVGATYDWRKIDSIPTKNAKKYLESKLRDIINVKFKTIDHYAGVRPATLDRRPFIGIHPENNNIGIFNGFGSKGVSLIPYFAKMFVNYLTKNNELEKEVNIIRYNYLY